MISEIQIDTLISKNKNCILVVGGEPVITNYTVTFCQNYFQQKDYYNSINDLSNLPTIR